MKSSAAKTALIAGAFVVLFGASMALQHRELARIEMNPPFLDKWSLSGRSAGLLKVAALRYDLVAADFLWLRAIQSFGGRGMTDRDWRPVYDLFDTITELDPSFEEAYTFGNMVIGDEAGKQREALKLVDKGIRNLPRRYRIPFEGMYVANWTLGDKQLARYYGRLAMKAANAPDWVPRSRHTPMRRESKTPRSRWVTPWLIRSASWASYSR